MRCSVTLMCFCSEALQIIRKRTTNTQGQINTTTKESRNMKTLYKTHPSYVQGQFQQVRDNTKEKSLVQSPSIKSQTISSRGKCVSLAYKTCYSQFFASMFWTGCKRNKSSPASKPPVLQNKCNLNKHKNEQTHRNY